LIQSIEITKYCIARVNRPALIAAPKNAGGPPLDPGRLLTARSELAPQLA
jgi:hypothetical protein